MKNYLSQPEIRQVLSSDAIAHPQQIKPGAEVEMFALFPYGEQWMARFFYNEASGCCDMRNLLSPAMYEMQRSWAQLQDSLDFLPSYERTACILSILDCFEDVQFDPTMSALLLSSLLSEYRR